MTAPAFALLGEPLALELANTIVAGEEGLRDLLVTDADARAWVRAQEARLPPGAGTRPPTAEQLRALRDAIRALVAAAMSGGAPKRADVERVNAASAAAPPVARLHWTTRSGPAAADAAAGQDPAAATLAAIARDAIALLGGPDRDRLRTCASEQCVLVFVAAHPRRRWCSPAVCGNRARVARHYRRRRAGRRHRAD